MKLLHSIDRHLAKQGISPSRFGREVLNDACFVHELRRGRQPRKATIARVIAALAEGAAR